MQNEIQNLNIISNQSRSSHYERAMLEKCKPFYDNYECNDTSFNIFSDTPKAQRLSKKFKRLDFVGNVK